MGLGKKTIDDQNYCGKKVLVRCDFNVPMKDGVITNENRISAALPTIQKLVNDGAKVILCSHLGKPKNGPEAKFSLAPVAVALSAKLGKTVVFADDDNVVGENAKVAVAAMNNGDVVLLQKREENALKLASTTPKAKIVDKAYASSKPVKPKVPMVLFLALCMAVFIPVTIIYLLHLLNTKFSSQDDLEEISAVPVIGHVHHNRHKEALVVRQGKTSAIVELFRYLRNNVQFMLTGPEAKVVLVTSSTSGEGKSFVSSNLAASFALLEGKKVVLVGMDIRSPKLADMLHLKPLPGVTSYLAKSDMRLDEIVQHMPGNESLDVIVAGAVPPNPSELLLGDRTGKLIAELRERYDYVIIDSAPVAQVSDTFSVAGMADATVYVTRANHTKRSMVKLMNRLVATKRLANVGAIVNDTKPSQDNSYGYGYGKNDDDK